MKNSWEREGPDASVTPSTRLLNQQLGVAPAPRRLMPSEIELLLASKRELAALAFGTQTQVSPAQAVKAR